MFDIECVPRALGALRGLGAGAGGGKTGARLSITDSGELDGAGARGRDRRQKLGGSAAEARRRRARASSTAARGLVFEKEDETHDSDPGGDP